MCWLGKPSKKCKFGHFGSGFKSNPSKSVSISNQHSISIQFHSKAPSSVIINMTISQYKPEYKLGVTNSSIYCLPRGIIHSTKPRSWPSASTTQDLLMANSFTYLDSAVRQDGGAGSNKQGKSSVWTPLRYKPRLHQSCRAASCPSFYSIRLRMLEGEGHRSQQTINQKPSGEFWSSSTV